VIAESLLGLGKKQKQNSSRQTQKKQAAKDAKE